GPRQPDRLVLAAEAVALVARLHPRLDLAPDERGGERARLDQLLDDLGELLLVVRANVGAERAARRDDVPRDAALDRADVRGGLLVEAAEPHVCDRARGGGNRRAALFRRDPRMCRTADERHLEDRRARRAEDDFPDRPRLVVDEPDPSRESAAVECVRALQADLLLRGEDELEARVRPPLLDQAARGL